MNGIFRKPKTMLCCYILCAVGGLFLTAFFIYAIGFGKFSSMDDIFGGAICIPVAILMAGFGCYFLYVNRKAFIRVNEQSVSAFSQCGFAFNCRISDIENVSYRDDQLCIQLKSGKKYHFIFLQNAYEIGRYIYRRISHKPVRQSDLPDLFSQIQSLQKKKSIVGYASLICYILVFVEIITAALLTDGKEMNQFSSADWSLFAVMAVIGIITFAAAAVMFCIWINYNQKHTQVAEMLNKTVLFTSPLEPGNAIRLFVNDERYPLWRIAVYGYPNSKEVYYTVEVLGTGAVLRTEYRSEIFPNMDALYDAIDTEVFDEISLPYTDAGMRRG